MIIKDGKRLFSLQEAADKLGVNIRTIRHYIYTSKFPLKKTIIGKVAYISSDDLLAYEPHVKIKLTTDMRSLIRQARIARGLTYREATKLIGRESYHLENVLINIRPIEWQYIKMRLGIE